MGELTEICATRRNIYRLLKNIFLGPPSKEFLGALSPGVGRGSSRGADLERGLEMLKRGSGAPQKDLVCEYTRLFVGPHALPAPPYESVYLSGDRLVMQGPAVEVRKRYRRAGLEIEDAGKPDDHVSAEFEFMEYLCGRVEESLKEGDEKRALEYLIEQKEFLEGHVLKWVPAFCRDIFGSSTSDFYRGAAMLTRGFLTLDGEEVDRCIKALKSPCYPRP